MFCPKCQAEYIAGVTTCPDCDVTLVDEPPGPSRKPRKQRPATAASDSTAGGADWSTAEPGDLVTVLRSADSGLLAVAQSLLRSADIPTLVRGEALQDLIGAGRIGGCNIVTGPAELQVRPEDAADAREILRELRPSTP